MRRLAGLLVLLPLLVACSDVQMLGATAAEKRRVMNDMQARATMAAVCDMSLGAYFRELNEIERRYAGLVCGDVGVMQAPLPPRAGAQSPLPEQLAAAERTGS
jgi:hypothetical protein